MGYVVGSVLVAYIVIHAYRHVRRRRDQSVALPRPVHEMVRKRSPFPFVRTNGEGWLPWKLPIHWTPSSAGSSLKGKAATMASMKDLSIELLPTTALPPPPTSMPTSPPLVDLSTPPALEASSGSVFSISLPSSPRAQPRSLWQRQPGSPLSLAGHRNIQHSAFPRPPSPHALLATTPPQKRSRSLGGVSVRRLSGGLSGLRNKVDVEPHDRLLGHERKRSEEHLLIDFSCSSDDQGSVQKDPITISPAASDIGVLSSSAMDNKVVEPRPMPLVDVGNALDTVSTDHQSDNTAWMWFKNAPSTIRSYNARILPAKRQADPFSSDQFTFPYPLPFPETLKLIDIPSSGDACLELDSLDSSRTLVEVESNFSGKEEESPSISAPEMSLDVPIFETTAVDPFSDDYAVDHIEDDVHANDDQALENDQDFLALVNVEGNETQVRNDQQPPSNFFPEEAEDSTWVAIGESLPSMSPTMSPVAAVAFSGPNLTTSPTSQVQQSDWRWVEADDLWNETLALSSTSDDVVDLHVGQLTQDQPRENEFVDITSGGSLSATVLNGEVADDEVPHLSLDDPNPAEELRLSRVLRGHLDDEDATPRPTPMSTNILLPDSNSGASLPAILIEDKTNNMVCNISEGSQPAECTGEQALVVENHPDPDLLPLPEFLSSVEVMRMTQNPEDELFKMKPRSSSQMPTPPASPPLLSAALITKVGKSLPPSPMIGPKDLGILSDVDVWKSPRSSSPPLQIPLPAVALEDKLSNLIQDVAALRLALPTDEFIENRQEGEEVEITSKTAMELHDAVEETYDAKDETPLPGSLPEMALVSVPSQTPATRLAGKSRPAPFHPSVQAIIRQPVEIALAMQLRPGLGAGADPAWMVRFLMAMFGWFAVLVSGQENY